MRLLPNSLAGRTLLLLIGMMFLLTLGSAILLHDERKERINERNVSHLLQRFTTLVRLLEDADDQERHHIIQRFTDDGDVIRLTTKPWIKRPPRRRFEHFLAHRIRRALHFQRRSDVRVRFQFHDKEDDEDEHERHEDDAHEHEHELRGQPRLGELKSVAISIPLGDEGWLNYQTERFQAPPPWAGKTLQLLGLLLALVIVSAFWIARWMTRPMKQLAEAAEQFGKGESGSNLPEQGPKEVRATIRAFNQMQQRLQKHLTMRSQMLAAVSHDLRTPITTLRLRAEYIEDAEMREKTLQTLAEMEQILSATLSFARDEAADEQARSTNLAALIQALVDDHADLGGAVSYQGTERLVFACRPVALKRAINNLLENALKYGEKAEVSLQDEKSQVQIIIEDQGPGIPEEKREEVFTPFYRLEESRNRETGGIGLGLAVARTIANAHGGQLILMNRMPRGLRAVLSLPK